MTHFETDLLQLRKTLLTMARQAETVVAQAMQALMERDGDLAVQVERDDELLDRLEKEIDELGINLLSKAPLATDLRLITVAMKVGHDLERVGDEATTIARRTLVLNQEPQLKPYIDLPKMAELGLAMLNEAIESFVDHNTTKARAIIPRDKDVDALNKQIHRELTGYMVERPATITVCLQLMTISKSLERIADHATNIAEDVVYLYEGRDIRHLDPKTLSRHPPAG